MDFRVNTAEQKEVERLLQTVIKTMAKDSVFILQSPSSKTRNHDVEYPYRTSSNLYYLTKMNLANSVLVIKKTGEILVYTPEINPEQERWDGPSLGRSEISTQLSIDALQVFDKDKFEHDLSQILTNQKILYYEFGESQAFDQKILSTLKKISKKARKASFAPRQIIHAGEILQPLRLHKSEYEITKMKQAASISAQAHKQLMQFSRQSKSMYEYQLKAFLEYQFFQKGAKAVAYPSIVAGENNATFLHYRHSDALVHNNQLVLVDAGCEWQGYSSDITRTFPLGGSFSPEQKEIYQLVYNAMQEAFKECYAGSSLMQIHERTVESLVTGLIQLGFFKKVPDIQYLQKRLQHREEDISWFENPSYQTILDEKLYFHYYMHQTSHFMGMDVHDDVVYFEKSQPVALSIGSVFSVEPGLYFSNDLEFVDKKYRGIGIRIEDTVAITKDGMEILSKEVPSHWQEIENLKKI